MEDDLGTAERLFGFLGIDLHPDVVSFCERHQRDRTPVNRPTSDLAASSPQAEWETLLAPDQRLRNLERLEGMLVEYGYETEESISRLRDDLERLVSGAPLDPLRSAVRESGPQSATVPVISDGDERVMMNLGGRTGWHFPQERDNV